MLNPEEFIKRLEFIMDHYSLSASSFADKVSVQRSSISHLLSGRNKPSLDFVMKILEVFPELNLYWILNGSGTFLQKENADHKDVDAEIAPKKKEVSVPHNLNTLFSDEKFANVKDEKLASPPIATDNNFNEKQIERIVLFYSDGTFQSYNPSSSK